MPRPSSVEELFTSRVRTPAYSFLRPKVAGTGLAELPVDLLQTIGALLPAPSFRSARAACTALLDALAFTAPGLKAAKQRGEAQLYDWQASNARLISRAMYRCSNGKTRDRAGLHGSESEGIVLCDAPGGGKTVSVLAAIARSMPAAGPCERRAVLVFAPKVIVPQWAAQIARHFDPGVSGLAIYCADKELHHYEESGAQRLSTWTGGGVYVEQRPSAPLPADLQRFDVLIFAKEMLSLRTNPYDTTGKQTKNDKVVTDLRRSARLLVVDESHNLNGATISNQMLNVEAFQRVPKLLLSGTPGRDPKRLYAMLRLIGHPSWRFSGGFRPWAAKRFEEGSRVRPEAEALLLEELNGAFLHTPRAVIFARQQASVEHVVELIEPNEIEADAYNYALSLHQRDVQRAGGRGEDGSGRPAEWAEQAPKDKKKKRGAEAEWLAPSAEKTVLELQMATNGAENWTVALSKKDAASLKRGGANAHPYLTGCLAGRVPACDACGLFVPGLLTRPCACPGAVCAECFEEEIGSRWGEACSECRRRRTKGPWRRANPYFDLRTEADRNHAADLGSSIRVQQQQQHQQHQPPPQQQQQPPPPQQQHQQHHSRTLLLRQPAPRHFEPLRAVDERPTFASRPLADLRAAMSARGDTAEDGAKVQRLALYLHRLAQEGAKVLIVPPAHRDVRGLFLERLSLAIGADSLADLNGLEGKAKSKLETAKALAKFKAGRGRYWQCASCGAVHEEATPACATPTYLVRLEAPAGGAPAGGAPAEALRFRTEVDRVDELGGLLLAPGGGRATLYIGNRAVVRSQSAAGEAATAPRFGTVVAEGSCSGKRPTDCALLVPAAAGSCFVLVLNASGIEGLDLGEATHLIKTEPIARRDKEQQAEARGMRLGSAGKLKIVSMLMRGTIEEAMHEGLLRKRAREEAGGVAQDGAGGSAALLNGLKLLRSVEHGQGSED